MREFVLITTFEQGGGLSLAASLTSIFNVENDTASDDLVTDAEVAVVAFFFLNTSFDVSSATPLQQMWPLSQL